MIMHGIDMLAAWFSLIIAGMILIMLMLRIVSESRGSEVNQDVCERIPAHQVVGDRMGSTILIEKEA